MQALKILTWHVHGSYLNTLAQIEHEWYLPVKPGRPEGYGGRATTFPLPAYIHEVPAEEVRDLELDLILYQSAKNYLVDRCEILNEQQQHLPRIYLEHNTPRPHATDTRHPVDDPLSLLVHVTQYNRLMWDNGQTPTCVIEHSVSIDPALRYQGHLARGLTVVNCMQRRPRIAGLDIFQQARARVPLDLAGMESETLDGLGDLSYQQLHAQMAEYRFLFSPIRYTSLPLAVIEAMTIGMPIIALATTELPTVIENGKNGYISCNIDELISHMQRLLADPAEAMRLGEQARATARARFGLPRFIADWNTTLARAISLHKEGNGLSVAQFEPVSSPRAPERNTSI
ncbi:MAG TPA: glycosyltransferase family 4 protein [Ktedonobacteraceae bacterium]|jgi:hypothetical protein